MGLSFLEVETSTQFAEDTVKRDFSVSFALRLHREETLDFWNVTEEMYWRSLFKWGMYEDEENIESTPKITVYRPNNTIGYFFHLN